MLTSDTDDVRSARLASGYSQGNVTFFAEPPAALPPPTPPPHLPAASPAARGLSEGPSTAAAAGRDAFEVLWNSPTGGCSSCTDPAAQLSHSTVEKYKITANPKMAFNGKEIVLLYSCGLWPTLSGVFGGGVPCWAEGADPSNCTYSPFTNITAMNGGVPQAGDGARSPQKTQINIPAWVFCESWCADSEFRVTQSRRTPPPPQSRSRPSRRIATSAAS